MQSRALSKTHEGLEIVKDLEAAESEETFTLLENKSGQLMDELSKGPPECISEQSLLGSYFK